MLQRGECSDQVIWQKTREWTAAQDHSKKRRVLQRPTQHPTVAVHIPVTAKTTHFVLCQIIPKGTRVGTLQNISIWLDNSQVFTRIAIVGSRTMALCDTKRTRSRRTVPLKGDENG